VSDAPVHWPKYRFSHPCSRPAHRGHARLERGDPARLSCGRLGHMAAGLLPGHDCANTATDAVSSPRPLNKRPTRRGEIVGPMPRVLTSSAHAREVQWFTGRSEAAGTAQATATIGQSCAGVYVACRPRRGASRQTGWRRPRQVSSSAAASAAASCGVA
jgi:hypothetical protein